MPTSIFEGCGYGCGWTAGLVATICFGTFGVPLKCSVANDAHPLVLQSYKTLVCFLTCWFVLLMGEEFTWTPWGIVSGMFWVPGAACGVYGIRHAGLAVAVGTWSSIVVISSFVWGIVIFEERVKNLAHTTLAFLLLMAGLVGMSIYSQPEPATLSLKGNLVNAESFVSDSDSEDEKLLHGKTKRKDTGSPTSTRNLFDLQSTFKRKDAGSPASMQPLFDPESPFKRKDAGSINSMRNLFEVESLCIDKPRLDAKDGYEKDNVVFFGGRLSLTRRQLGILGAAINGAWGGLNLIPMHIASNQGFKGASYLISYATGSMIVNVVIWIIIFLNTLYQKRGSIDDAIESFPKFHIKTLWLPGLLSGCLYSVGNLSAILSVTHLGQGIGMSMCQGQLLVSGLWGIFYYGEIKGGNIIMKWFISALVAVAGILWLSQQHESPTHRRLMALVE